MATTIPSHRVQWHLADTDVSDATVVADAYPGSLQAMTGGHGVGVVRAMLTGVGIAQALPSGLRQLNGRAGSLRDVSMTACLEAGRVAR